MKFTEEHSKNRIGFQPKKKKEPLKIAEIPRICLSAAHLSALFVIILANKCDTPITVEQVADKIGLSPEIVECLISDINEATHHSCSFGADRVISFD